MQKNALYFKFFNDLEDKDDYIEIKGIPLLFEDNKSFLIPNIRKTYNFKTTLTPNKEKLLITTLATEKLKQKSKSATEGKTLKLRRMSIVKTTIANFLVLDQNMYKEWSFSTSSIVTELLSKNTAFQLKRHLFNNESTLYFLVKQNKAYIGKKEKESNFKQNINKYFFYSIYNKGTEVKKDSITLKENLVILNSDFKLSPNGDAVFSALVNEIGSTYKKGIYTCVIDKYTKQIKSKNLSFFDIKTNFINQPIISQQPTNSSSSVLNQIYTEHRKNNISYRDRYKFIKRKYYNRYHFEIIPTDSLFYILAEHNYVNQSEPIKQKDTIINYTVQHIDNLILSGVGLTGEILWTKTLEKKFSYPLKRSEDTGYKTKIRNQYKYSLKDNELSIITKNLKDKNRHYSSQVYLYHYNSSGFTNNYNIPIPTAPVRYGFLKLKKRNRSFNLNINEIIKVSENEMILPVKYSSKNKRLKKIGTLKL